MKIEKLNDNQIRCTLTKDDLADRQIKLSELAYGSEKQKKEKKWGLLHFGLYLEGSQHLFILIHSFYSLNLLI